jgi:branched-chain amino acid transport system ATP-binding protein
MLEVTNVAAGYGKFEILHGVSLQAKQNEITCIIGPNGSGKSTLLKTIMGLIKPSSGKITLDDKEVTGFKPPEVLATGIQYIPQGRTTFRRMTVQDNLEMGAYTIKNRSEIKERLEEVFSVTPILRERRNQLAGSLSGGEQTMLCVGRALMLRPRVIMFDEPSLGLAPIVVDAVYQKIADLRRKGKIVIIVEQNVRKALTIADFVYVLDLGQNRFKGKPEEIEKDKKLVQLYLGLCADRDGRA